MLQMAVQDSKVSFENQQRCNDDLWQHNQQLLTEVASLESKGSKSAVCLLHVSVCVRCIQIPPLRAITKTGTWKTVLSTHMNSITQASVSAPGGREDFRGGSSGVENFGFSDWPPG